MWRIVSYLCLTGLMIAHFCSPLSEGAVFPCFEKDTQFNNRTMWARMGGAVSFTFCAESSVRVYERINISHPNHRNGWYPPPAGVEETLDVRVLIHHRTAEVTIKVTELQPADFNETFAVTLFAADMNGSRINATSTFFFVIEETGAVFPCVEKDTQFRAQTLWARMGGAVSFTFCAESSVRVYERISISHPNHRYGWYPLPAGVEETLDVRVLIQHHTAEVTIKVKELQPADFNETFTVTLFAADVNGSRINDTSTFFFVIEETDKDTTVLTTPSALINTAVDDTAQLMTYLKHTTTGCVDQSNGRTRHFVCHVIEDICLTVFVGMRTLTPMDQCAAANASHVADFNSIEILKPCLSALLQLPPVPIVRLGETRYIDTRNWTEVKPQSPYRVPCLIGKQQLAAPVITWFTLQQWDDQRETILWQHNLLDHNNSSVAIPATNNMLNVTCQASGYPKPEVTILRDNETLEISPDGISLQLNHAFYGEFICQATNVLKSGPTHIRVLVLETESLKTPAVLFDGSTRSVVQALELGLCMLLVAMLLLFVFLCLRRQVNRAHGRRDLVQGQVEIPMVATQAGPSTRHGRYRNVDDTSNYSLPRPQ